MTWKPGQSGNPTGVQGAKPKLVRDALKLEFAAFEIGDPVEIKPNTYRDMARAMITKACAGDVSAFTEIANRIDGKVPTPVTGGDEDDPAIRMIHRIERVIVDVDHRDGNPVPPAPEAEPL